MAGLPARPFNLCAGTELAGYAVRMGVSPGGADVTMNLRPAAKIRLLIKGPDGAPMAKAWPNVTKLGGAPISVSWMGPRAPSDSAGVAERFAGIIASIESGERAGATFAGEPRRERPRRCQRLP